MQCKKIDLTVDEGKEQLNPSREEKLRRAPQKDYSCVAFLLCDPIILPGITITIPKDQEEV